MPLGIAPPLLEISNDVLFGPVSLISRTVIFIKKYHNSDARDIVFRFWKKGYM